jgi:hypothetical protein
MAKETVRFVAVKTEKKPATVKFRTKSGRNGLLQGSEDCQEEKSRTVSREEKMKRIYLDSNVLIAHFSVDKAEEAKKKLVENALEVFAQLKDVQLCTSIWAITEMVNILVWDKKMARAGTLPRLKVSL